MYVNEVDSDTCVIYFSRTLEKRSYKRSSKFFLFPVVPTIRYQPVQSVRNILNLEKEVVQEEF